MTANPEMIAALRAQLALLEQQPIDASGPPSPPLLKLDFGCGPRKADGFEGVDQFAMPGVDHVLDVRGAWPWADASVDEAFSSHFVEHLTQQERVHFFNELHRVLKPGAKASIVCPNWSSARAYGDPTHRWPAISDWFFLYLNKDWRKVNAPHADTEWNKDGYSCDFAQAGLGYLPRPDLVLRNHEFQASAFANLLGAAQDIQATLVRK